MAATLKLLNRSTFSKISRFFFQQPIGVCYKQFYSTKKTGIGGKRKTKQKKQKIYRKHPVIEHVLSLQNEAKNETVNTVLLKENENAVHSVETNRSQVLGFNVDEFRKRIDLFCACDVSLKDSVTLSLSIPSSLHINNSNFKKVLKILRAHGLPLEVVIYKYPYLGSIDHRQVQRNVDLLEEFQIQKEILCDLVIENPLLLAYPLNKSSAEILKKSSFGLDETSTMVQNLVISLETPAVENENIKKFITSSDTFDPSVNMEVIEFLSSYAIDWKKVYLECPELLLASKKTIEHCTDTLVSAPFYFSIEDIEKLLGSYPGVFLSFSQENVLAMVKYLETVTITQNHLYKILSQYPEIFQDPEKFFRRVELFKNAGTFTDKHIGLLLSQKGGTNCFIECDDFKDEVIEELLKFYLKEGDLDAKQIIFSAPVSLSVNFKDTIELRVWYLRYIDKVKDITKRRKKQKSHVTLQTIIKADLKSFVEEFCGRTLEHYEESLKLHKQTIK